MNFRKIAPIVVVVTALISIYLNYLSYKELKDKECNCGGEKYSPIE